METERRPVEAELRPKEVEPRPAEDAKPTATPAPSPDTHEPDAEPVAGSAQHIRPRSAAGADVSDQTPRRSKRNTEDDLEVPSFLRRRG